MDIRLGRLKMPIENSLGYYELPSGDVSTTTQPSSSGPVEKPLANNCQPEQSDSHDTQDESARYNCLFYICSQWPSELLFLSNAKIIAGRLTQLHQKRAWAQAQCLQCRAVSPWTSRRRRRKRRRTVLISETKSGTPSGMTVTLTEVTVQTMRRGHCTAEDKFTCVIGDRLEHHWSILYICVTCVAIREENKKAWKSGLRFWNSNRRVRICYWCICLLSVCCPSVVRPLSINCLFVVCRMSVCCLFDVRPLSVCYPSIVCGLCVVRPLSVCCLSVVRALCVCGPGQSVAVCDNTQHLNETESETPILFSIPNSDTFLIQNPKLSKKWKRFETEMSHFGP